jgi:hypothetical protein
MLPFLKQKDKGVGMLNELMTRRGDRAKVSPVVESKDNPDHNDELEEAATALLSAIQSQSVQGVRDALKQAFDCLDAAPHIEADHSQDEE